MRKSRFLTNVISLAVAFTGLALAGCSQSESERKYAELEQVYAQYVSIQKAEGLRPLPFDKWFEKFEGGLLDKGDLLDKLEGKHEHVWKTEYSFDDETHWLGCEKCDKVNENAEHTADKTGVCTVCDGLVAPTEGVQYAVSWDGTYAKVVGYNGTATRVRFDGVYNGLPVTMVEAYAFDGNRAITQIVIPDSVESVGNFAFRNCENLKTVKLGGGVNAIANYAFLSCDSLTNISVSESNATYSAIDGNLYDKAQTTLAQYAIGKEDAQFALPERVTAVGVGAFTDCKYLTQIELVGGVETVGVDAFKNCDNLASVAVGETVRTIGDYAFYDCDKLSDLTLANGLNEIANGVFAACDRLERVVISDSVTSLGVSAFANCANLSAVEIGAGVREIADKTFKNCEKLTSVSIGKEVRLIGDEAFQNCHSLRGLEILRVAEIGKSAFENCYSLTSLELSKYLGPVGDKAFSGCYRLVEIINRSRRIGVQKGSTQHGGIGYYALEVHNETVAAVESNLTIDDGFVVYTKGEKKIVVGYFGEEKEVSLPADTTEINDYAFYNCSNLTSIVVGDRVMKIGANAFENCSNLKTVQLGKGVVSIMSCAFKSCSALKNITIPASVWIMGEAVFARCDKITVYCEAASQPKNWNEFWLYCNGFVQWKPAETPEVGEEPEENETPEVGGEPESETPEVGDEPESETPEAGDEPESETPEVGGEPESGAGNEE